MKASFTFKNILLALLFSIVYILCYKYFLYHWFEYAGFPFYEKHWTFILFSCVVSIMPISLYRGYRAISSLIAVIIYILLYIPTILTFALGSNEPISQIFWIQLVFMGAMCLFFVADKFVLVRSFDNRKFGFVSARFFMILAIISTLYLLYIYRGNFVFVSFKDVYIQRTANNMIGTDTLSKYLMSWLVSLFMPICVIYGLFNKKYSYFIVGCIASIVIYMATAAKGALLMPVILLCLYILLLKERVKDVYSYIVLLLSFSLIGLLALSPQPISIIFYISSLFMWRIVGVGGNLNLWYYDYFTNHPQTLYSHIRPVDFFTQSYPYGDLGLGQVIGKHYWSQNMNANANFWATDGFAAYGLTGVVIISFVFAFVLIFLNTISKKYDKLFLLLLFIPFLGSILNTSLFSTMWSGGGFFIILLLLFIRRDQFPQVGSAKSETTFP